MKLVLLSRSARVPSTRQLLVAGRARGHQVRVLDPGRLQLVLEGQERSRLLYGRKRLALPDAVIPRLSGSLANHGLPVLEQLSAQGAAVLNSAESIERAQSQARCLQRLAAAGIAIPRTLVARSASDLKDMVDRVGGVPVLVKLVQGGQRRVMACESVESLEAVLEALLRLGHQLLLQEYVRTTGRDLRVYVVGGKALSAVERVPRRGQFTRSLHHLAHVQPVELSEGLAEVARAAARVLGLEVCGVDLLQRKGSYRVFEVNPSPALPDPALGVDLALAIVERAEALAAV